MDLRNVTWHAGDEPAIHGAKHIDEAWEAADVQSRLADAIAALADKLGGEDDPAEQIDALAEEYAFIEALRDRHVSIARAQAVLNGIKKLHSSEMSVSGELETVLRLIGIPVKGFHELLQGVDERLLDIETLLADFEESERAIQLARNDLYRRMSGWDAIIDYWGRIDSRSPDMFNLVKRARGLYRLLAPRHMPVDDWVLLFAEDEGAQNLKYGGAITR